MNIDSSPMLTRTHFDLSKRDTRHLQDYPFHISPIALWQDLSHALARVNCCTRVLQRMCHTAQAKVTEWMMLLLLFLFARAITSLVKPLASRATRTKPQSTKLQLLEEDSAGSKWLSLSQYAYINEYGVLSIIRSVF